MATVSDILRVSSGAACCSPPWQCLLQVFRALEHATRYACRVCWWHWLGFGRIGSEGGGRVCGGQLVHLDGSSLFGPLTINAMGVCGFPLVCREKTGGRFQHSPRK